MTTIETLYRDAPESRDYDQARARKVSEIATYAADFVKDGVDAARLAEALMASAEEMGRFDGDAVSGEIAGRYTRNGNPVPFTI